MLNQAANLGVRKGTRGTEILPSKGRSAGKASPDSPSTSSPSDSPISNSETVDETGDTLAVYKGAIPAKTLPDSLTPVKRPRRLRSSAGMRRLVAQTRVSASQLILPVFARDGIAEPKEIPSMPGVYQHTVESLVELGKQAVDVGVGGIIVFGVPQEEDKDFIGSNAWDPRGIQNRAIRALTDSVGEKIVIMADTCLDETTSHGHCGPLNENATVNNDWAVSGYQLAAVAQAQAGAAVVAPSGMMDGQVRAIRAALDDAGYEDVAIMAYSAKYASGLFGPFRDAVGCALKGDRRSYQQDPANRREGLHETRLDLQEGADMVMVKPASLYLDVLADVAQISPVPVAAYQVSGEYSMIEAAAAQGWIDRDRMITESLTSIARAGADLILTYYALEAAQILG